MNRMEQRRVIRDSYDLKQYEIIQIGSDVIIFDYSRGYVLSEEESAEVKKLLNLTSSEDFIK